MESKDTMSKVSDGACADTIAAKNFLRKVVGGISAHSNHGRHLVLTLKEVASGKTHDLQIKDEKVLYRAARLYGVKEEGGNAEEVALELSNLFLNEFSEQEGLLKTLKLAPKKRQGIWEAAGIEPKGIDRTTIEAMYKTTTDVDNDYLNLLHNTFQVSLADGWGCSRIASICSDILFGTPSPVRTSVDNLKNGNSAKANIPANNEIFVAGFSVDAIKYMLGGRYRASFRPLNDAIIANRILGITGIVGCNDAKQKTDDYTNTLTRELVKRNILVLQTGCLAVESAEAGLLKPEAALENAGAGLREFCETVGIPPVLHMGSGVDDSRILEVAAEIVFEGGLGDDIAGLPAVCVVPECMNEMATVVGCYFVASGVDVILGSPLCVSGSQVVGDYLHNKVRDEYGASFHFIDDPLKAADLIIELINKARDALGINKKTERKLFDMKDRRAL